MAEEEALFDNWQEEAELEETKQVNQQPAKEQAKIETEAKETSTEVPSQKKPEPIDPQKVFNQRLAAARQINEDKFQAYFQNLREQSTNQQIVIGNQILKNDKDFAQFAKKVGKKFNDVLTENQDENIEDDRIYDFFEEIVFLVYNQLEWKNIESTKDKLRIVKKQKKEQEAKIRKQKQKEQRMKKLAKQAKQEEVKSPSKDKKEEDDIFGGATLVNSKQVEEQIKAKGFEKVQAKKVEVEDDDDFM